MRDLDVYTYVRQNKPFREQVFGSLVVILDGASGRYYS